MLRKLLLLLIAFLFLIPASYANTATNDAEQVQLIKQQTEKFYSAVNAMLAGNPQPLGEVMDHSSQILYRGADGQSSTGWAATYEDWQKQAALKLGGTVKPEEITVVLGSELAFSYNTVVGEQPDKDSTSPHQISLRAISVFRKMEDGDWKMIAHQADILPFLEKLITEE